MSSAYDRFVLGAGLAGWVWYRWGLDRALGFVVLPALALHGLRLLAEMTRGQFAARLPRFVIVALAVLAIANRLTASDDERQRPPKHRSIFTDMRPFPDENGNCVLSPLFSSLSDVEYSPEDSPYYTPTTYIRASEPVTPTCPTDDSGRQTNFNAPPPVCIDPDGTYVASVITSHGEFRILLYTEDSPDAVNSLAFLAGWGYWDGVVLDAPRLGLEEGYRACRADWGDVCDTDAERLADYAGIPWMRTRSPFDPASDDYGPGYSLQVEPAAAPYDTERVSTHQYVVLPYAATTVDDDRNETQWVDPGEWFIVFSPNIRAALNDQSRFYTPVGELDDPDGIVTQEGIVRREGPITSFPFVIETVIIETPDQLANRQERQDIQDQLDDIEDQLADLDREREEKANPPLGDEPAPLDDFDAQRYDNLTEEHDALVEQLQTLEDDYTDMRAEWPG